MITESIAHGTSFAEFELTDRMTLCTDVISGAVKAVNTGIVVCTETAFVLDSDVGADFLGNRRRILFNSGSYMRKPVIAVEHRLDETSVFK